MGRGRRVFLNAYCAKWLRVVLAKNCAYCRIESELCDGMGFNFVESEVNWSVMGK